MGNQLTFTDRQAFRGWLEEFGEKSGGVWLLFGKNEKLVTITMSEALEEAICHGWIDGQMQSIDENSYKKYFAHRLPNSKWSPKNKALAQTLIEKGLMAKPGLDAIEHARKNGSWDNAQKSVIDDNQIQLFKESVKPYEPAYSNLLAMSNSVQRTYTGFYFDTKTEAGRETRLKKIIDRLNKNLKPM